MTVLALRQGAPAQIIAVEAKETPIRTVRYARITARAQEACCHRWTRIHRCGLSGFMAMATVWILGNSIPQIWRH